MLLPRSLPRCVLVLLAAAAAWVAAPAAPAAAAPPALGATPGTAAPSCWYIKQVDPAAVDGAYWLQTPALVAPARFSCDMTTDGGGWVVVGRGREGWSFSPTGQRSAADIVAAPTGTAAFPPAALPTETVDGLLNRGAVSGLSDGILLKRAAVADGSSSQLVTWRPLHPSGWNWSFAGGNQLASTVVDGVSYTGGNTRDPAETFAGQVGPGTGSTNDARRVFTFQWAQHAYQAGFSYGAPVAGSSSPTSYLWTSGSEGHAVPFTSVLLRPRLGPFTYSPVPDAGTPATTRPPLLRSQVEPLSGWGVTGVLEVGDSEPLVDSPVLSFAEVGGTVFVGGKFARVQQGAAGPPVDQPYLAAFSRATGAWISSFRPVLDGTVWSLSATPDGQLLVAGQFTNVNGVSGTTALARLDPSTGAVVPGWRAGATPPTGSSTRALVRTVDVQGPWVYVGGLFSALTGPGGATVAEHSLGRVALATGEPDTAFRPNSSGQVYDVDATADRVYAVGTFEQVNGTAVNNVAVLRPVDGTLVGGLRAWEPTAARDYQQTVQAVGSEVWQGGSEHSLQVYRASDYAVVGKSVTADAGGDFQSLAELDGYVYASGHFSRYTYTDASTWPGLAGFTRADRALFVGAWDATTHTYQTGFAPALRSPGNEGVWALMPDSTQCLWAGGDLDLANGQWAGGFVKYCQVDHVAPSVPTGPTASAGSGGVALAWSPSTDAAGTPRYEVLRNDRVVLGSYGATSWTDPQGTAADRYVVRAVDAAGNRSASTRVIAFTADTTKPSVPKDLATSVTGSGVTLTWSASTDNVGVSGYRVFRNGADIGTVAGTTTTDTRLADGTYSYQVQAFDAAGNTSGKTAPVSATVKGSDTTPPTAPRDLAGTVSGTSATLTWTAATDNVAVTGYTVYRNGAAVVDVPGTGATLTGLPRGNSYVQVQAFDVRGNRSAKTAPLTLVVP